MRRSNPVIYYSIIVLIVFMSASAFSADPAPLSKDIASVEDAYKKCDDLTASFTQSTEIQLVGKVVKRSGTFSYKRGGKLRIEYAGKDGKHYVSDGTTLWVYVPGDPESLEAFAVNNENVPKEALSFLGGFGKMNKEFVVTKSSAFPDAQGGSAALHLKPRSKSAHYESLDALFGADHLLAKLIINNASGNISRYDFSSVKTNPGLSDGQFSLSSGKATPDQLPK